LACATLTEISLVAARIERGDMSAKTRTIEANLRLDRLDRVDPRSATSCGSPVTWAAVSG
jgi:hypothetical protein